MVYHSTVVSNPNKTSLDGEIEEWRDIDSKEAFEKCGYKDPTDDKIWVIKYTPVKYLSKFLDDPKLKISTIPGFTWGDGVYIAPLKYAYSTAMYGRVGVVGYISSRNVRHVYDASQTEGIRLYQEWIRLQKILYTEATTKVYSPLANRYLRNLFRSEFNIDIVFFHPDEFNRSYVAPTRDHWFALSDWAVVPPGEALLPLSKPTSSNKVEECRWVVRVEEAFEADKSHSEYISLMGHKVKPPAHDVADRPHLYNILKGKHSAQGISMSAKEPNLKDIYLLGISY
jgi:hypothetical protein